MVTPRPGRTPPPPLAPPVVLGDGRGGGGGPGTPAGFNTLERRGDTLGFLGLGGGIRRCLGGHLAGVDDQKADVCHGQAPVRVLHGHAADAAVPRPAARRLLAAPPRLCEPYGEGTVLLAHASPS